MENKKKSRLGQRAYVTLALANFAFLLCDYVIGLLTVLYVAKLRKKYGFERIFRK